MRRLLFIFFVFICSIVSAQVIEPYDTCIDMGYYKSYYNYKTQSPSYVIYKLYQPKKVVNRKGLNFKSYNNLPHFEYAKSGYDKGHLYPAQDAASSKENMESTFYYINAVPQHPKLNRGSWKKYETSIRKASEKDSLIIICGGCDYDLENILIPRNCFKIVYSLSSKKCIFGLLFTNDQEAKVWDCNEYFKEYTCDYVKRFFESYKNDKNLKYITNREKINTFNKN